MSVEIEEKDFGLDDILDDIASAKGRNALAGYHNRGASIDEVDVAKLAIFNEFGTKNAPARPSMRLSFDNNVDDLANDGSKLFKSYVEGKIDLEMALEVWGDNYLNLLRNGITSRELGLTANAESTIKRKGSDTPLVDTSRMINSSTVEIE